MLHTEKGKNDQLELQVNVRILFNKAITRRIKQFEKKFKHE